VISLAPQRYFKTFVENRKYFDNIIQALGNLGKRGLQHLASQDNALGQAI
jgi:hypothetical protein